MTDHGKPLREDDVDADPLRQFERWFAEAGTAGVREPQAAALATVSGACSPSLRMVLVKTFDLRGFVFYSNYASRKGRELDGNRRAALLFHWDPLGRQVRIEGEVTRAGAEETAAYVRSRPRGSQLSALASPQSEVIASREVLERHVAELEREHPGEELPLPRDWGGLRLNPDSIEFWQQRHDRLHDRLRYRAGSDGAWLIERLAP